MNYNLKSREYSYLDSKEFISKHILQKKNQLEFSFYLEGIHCLACLWLVEKLPELNIGVISSRLNLGKNTVQIIAREEASFAKIAFKLHSLGYKPHPIIGQNDSLRLQQIEERKDFLKLGVAAFCAMNNMLYAVSLYSGATGKWEVIFSYISFILSIPIVFFCAFPFYKSAFSSLKNKIASIDLPISVAIISGFIISTLNLMIGGHLYFDSITVLVFFLLLSRVILKTFQAKHLNQNDISSYFLRTDIKRWSNKTNQFEYIQEKEIKKNDLIKVEQNEIIPCDGKIEQGQTSIQMSVLNGEPIPVMVKKGDLVFAGTTNIGESFLLTAKEVGTESKLGKILKEVKSNLESKAPITTLLEKISKYFILFIFFISLVSAIYFLYIGGLYLAIERSLTLLIVTCPCALALATPLSFSKAFSLCQKFNLVAKDESIFEKASLVKNIFVDKTGTITEGHFKVSSWEEQSFKPEIGLNISEFNLKSLIYKMEENSNHPIGKSIKDYLSKEIEAKQINIKDLVITEIIGQGVFASIKKEKFQLIEIESSPNKKILGLKYNNKIITKIELEDSILKENLSILKKWNKNYNLYLISGDNQLATKHLGNLLGLKNKNIFSKQTPNSKAKIVSKFADTLMIGDGVNDTLAFTKSMLSISVFGSVESSLQTADLFCLTKGLGSIDKLFTISRETLKIIKRNIVFSIGYNIFSIILVFTGHISPLIAAILMPISSLSVIFSTIIGTKELRMINELNSLAINNSPLNRTTN